VAFVAELGVNVWKGFRTSPKSW